MARTRDETCWEGEREAEGEEEDMGADRVRNCASTMPASHTVDPVIPGSCARSDGAAVAVGAEDEEEEAGETTMGALWALAMPPFFALFPACCALADGEDDNNSGDADAADGAAAPLALGAWEMRRVVPLARGRSTSLTKRSWKPR